MPATGARIWRPRPSAQMPAALINVLLSGLWCLAWFVRKFRRSTRHQGKKLNKIELPSNHPTELFNVLMEDEKRQKKGAPQ